MKITKTKLREMIEQALKEISGTRGGTADIARLKQMATDLKTKMAAKKTKQTVKKGEEAVKIMLHVHQKGVGVCGIYTYEVAETKVTQVVDYARANQHPLQCTLEQD